jgi:hypothetical protein
MPQAQQRRTQQTQQGQWHQQLPLLDHHLLLLAFLLLEVLVLMAGVLGLLPVVMVVLQVVVCVSGWLSATF